MTPSEQVRSLDSIDLDEVERLAGWATRFGPARIREDIRSEARLRVLEALAAGSTTGLGRVAYRGAVQAFRGATYLAGEWQSRQAWESDQAPVVTSDLSEEHSENRSPVPIGGLRRMWPVPSNPGTGMGPVLDRLVDILSDHGVARESVVDAISVLVDATATRPHTRRTTSDGRTRVSDVPARSMAESSGLSAAQCCALKTLVLGERSRPDRGRAARPGLLVRAHRGENVWADPRAVALIAQIVRPDAKARLGWAEPTPRPLPVVRSA